MITPRLSIAGVMAGAAIIAINLAILRTLHAYDPDLDQGLALTWVAVQYGVVRSARGRGRGRAAWVGFVAAGSAAMLSFAWCEADQGSTMFWLWSEYTRHSNRWLNRTTHVWDFYNRTRIDAVCVGVQAVAWSAPQLAFAASVGVATRWLSAWRPGGVWHLWREPPVPHDEN